MGKRVLFITPEYPFLANGGGLYKTQRLLVHLDKNYELYTYAIYHGMVKNGCVHKVAQRLRRPRNFFNFIKSVLFGVPLSIYRNKFSCVASELDALLAKVDVIIIDHFLSFQYVPQEYHVKTLYHAHNAEYVMWEMAARQERNPVKSWLVASEAARVKRYEINICKKVSRILASPNDQQSLLCADDKCSELSGKFFDTYHLGPEPDVFDASVNTKSGGGIILGFVGNLGWDANLDGIRWFINECWPAILGRVANISLVIVGQGEPTVLEHLGQYRNVSALGFVADLEPVLSQFDIALCPLRFGSGMKVKNTLALYRGIPLITTDVGAEGFEFKNYHDAVICASAADFVNAVCRLAMNETERQMIGCNGRQLAFARYTWQRVFECLDAAIHDVSP